ncbi:putative ATP-grasp-modified RiPP [Leifsonia sp. NPDC102414]|uniref:putative ATP-grasp-modified RiPP n=1 Tax=Leifsonia sp. NPDC102414 TaxID=3364124 RepID=UPI00380B10A0
MARFANWTPAQKGRHRGRTPPVPSGIITPTPWGLQRMAPYPTMAPAYAHTELDPATQTARFFDGRG